MQTWIMLNAPEPAGPEPASTEPSSTEPTQLQLRSAAATFALLGSAPRLHLAWLMAHETSDVGTLARRVGLSIPTTSQHLAKLRLAGIVSARREGRHTYYTIEDRAHRAGRHPGAGPRSQVTISNATRPGHRSGRRAATRPLP